MYRGQKYILIGSGKKITALMETSFWQSKPQSKELGRGPSGIVSTF
jgi:hypothetical protein